MLQQPGAYMPSPYAYQFGYMNYGAYPPQYSQQAYQQQLQQQQQYGQHHSSHHPQQHHQQQQQHGQQAGVFAPGVAPRQSRAIPIVDPTTQKAVNLPETASRGKHAVHCKCCVP